jgi:tRNA-dihydrouridine synthase A
MPIESQTSRHRFCVAPMMDWTDRNCRFFHRRLTRHALLYTEMVTAAAIRHGDRARLLGFDPAELPVALQIGGSDPALLAEVAKVGEDFGYCEINLNVGCPSAGTGGTLRRLPDGGARSRRALRGGDVGAGGGAGHRQVPHRYRRSGQ